MTWFMDQEFLERLDLRGYDAPAIAQRLQMDVGVVARFVDPARRYKVQTNETYGWLAGAANGRPALIFVGAPRLSGGDQAPINAVVFDDDSIRTPAIHCDDDLLDDRDALLELLADELGFDHLGSAEVRAFKHPQLWHYAVVPFPWNLHDIALGESEDADDDLPTVRSWIQDGCFVVHCGNGYWLSADGEVESS